MVKGKNNTIKNERKDNDNSQKQVQEEQDNSDFKPITITSQEELTAFATQYFTQGAQAQKDQYEGSLQEFNDNFPYQKINSPLPTFQVSKRFKSPKRAYSLLSKEVKGQKDAKQVLISAFEVHKNDYLSGSESRSRAHVLLAGKDNTGKESLVKNLAKIQDVPFVKVNFHEYDTSMDFFSFLVNSIHEQLQVSIDVHSDDYYLVNSAGGLYDKQFILKKYKKNSHLAIIYFDGINDFTSNDFYSRDKIQRKYTKNYFQQSLVSFLEEDIPLNLQLDSNSPISTLSTKNMLFVGAGNFDRLENLIQKRLTGKGLAGFKLTASYPDAKSFDESKVFSYAQHSDFLDFGFIPKLIGDFSSFAYTNNLDVDDFKSILNDKNSYLNKKLFEYSSKGVKISINDEAKNLVAKHLVDNSSNAGGIKNTVDRLLQPLIFSPDKKYSIGADHVKKYLGHAIFRNSQK